MRVGGGVCVVWVVCGFRVLFEDQLGGSARILAKNNLSSVLGGLTVWG